MPGSTVSPRQRSTGAISCPGPGSARAAPSVAEWLTRRHISSAIDGYSIAATERVLERAGYVTERPEVEPAVAFLDLTGFTRLTQVHGDATAARVALRLADLSGGIAASHGGRVVKLLGDGVLMWFAEVDAAVDASLTLLDRLAAADLPPGHVGVTQGPVVSRDGDIFGRTVNLAARISDATPSGLVYLPTQTGDRLADRFRVEPVGTSILSGIGPVDLAQVTRT